VRGRPGVASSLRARRAACKPGETHANDTDTFPRACDGYPLHAAFGGLHHLYANATALAGYRSGRFDDGAVIVFGLLNSRVDSC